MYKFNHTIHSYKRMKKLIDICHIMKFKYDLNANEQDFIPLYEFVVYTTYAYEVELLKVAMDVDDD